MSQVKIINQEKFEELKKTFAKDGFQNIHLLFDFDGTLICKFVDGKKRPFLISVFRDEGYLTSDYPEKAKALFEKYHPMENDQNLNLEERKGAMEKWWREHFELLIKSGLSKKDVEKVIKSQDLEFRQGVKEIFEMAESNKIPVLIISAGGLGEESINIYLEDANLKKENVEIISNAFLWGEGGKAISVRKPIVHSLNKDETVLSENVQEKIKNRKNVILVGDNLGDISMVGDFEYDNLLKIGLLNEQDEQKEESFVENFYVVIKGDSDLDFLVDFLKEIK